MNATQLIYLSLVGWCVSIHGLLHISGLYQFIDVIVCGEHSRLLGISKTGTFFIYIMAALSILSFTRRTHVLEESQYLNVIGRWLPQLVQFSVEEKQKKSSEGTKKTCTFHYEDEKINQKVKDLKNSFHLFVRLLKKPTEVNTMTYFIKK